MYILCDSDTKRTLSIAHGSSSALDFLQIINFTTAETTVWIGAASVTGPTGATLIPRTDVVTDCKKKSICIKRRYILTGQVSILLFLFVLLIF